MAEIFNIRVYFGANVAAGSTEYGDPDVSAYYDTLARASKLVAHYAQRRFRNGRACRFVLDTHGKQWESIC
jgi:hypothetical protein